MTATMKPVFDCEAYAAFILIFPGKKPVVLTMIEIHKEPKHMLFLVCKPNMFYELK